MNTVTEHEVINSVKIIKACEIMSYQLKLKKKKYNSNYLTQLFKPAILKFLYL